MQGKSNSFVKQDGAWRSHDPILQDGVRILHVPILQDGGFISHDPILQDGELVAKSQQGSADVDHFFGSNFFWLTQQQSWGRFLGFPEYLSGL